MLRRRDVRPLTVVVALLLTASLARPPAAAAATWVAQNTIAGTALGASIETWEAAPVDYDRDGDQDLWIGYHDQGGKIWSNDGDGTYTLVHTWPRRNADGRVPDRHDCAWADVDGNSWPDAYCASGRGGNNLVKTGQDNELWLQGPKGQFRDVGTTWGLGDVCGRSHYVAFLDADHQDGPDLFVGNATPRDVTGDPCDNPANGLPNEEMKFYLNRPSPETGFMLRPDLGITGFGGVRFAEVVDYDDDTWDDLFVSYSGGPILYRNDDGDGFTDVSSENGLNGNPADAAFGDLDRDGDPDLVTTEGARVDYRLNTGAGFGPPVRAYAVPPGGEGRSVALGDADSDGDLDVYALVSDLVGGTNPRDVVLRNTGLQFSPVQVPTASGVGDAVIAIDGRPTPARRAEFLVLNGVEVSGPIQRVELRFR